MSSRRLSNVCLITQSGAVFITESNCGIRVEIRPDLTIAMFLVNYKGERNFRLNINGQPKSLLLLLLLLLAWMRSSWIRNNQRRFFFIIFSPQFPVVMFETLKLNLQVIRVGRRVVITQGFGKVAQSSMLPADQNVTRAFVITNSVLDTGRIISSTAVVDSKSKISS